MRNILTIAGKELRVYLTTGTSYVLFGAFIFITAFFFHRLVIEFQLQAIELTQRNQAWAMDRMNLTDWVMAPVFMNITIFLLFMLPMLTMRLFAEERKGKTLELMMTVPVRPIELVLGKYIGALVIVAIMLGLTLIFPVLLQIFGGGEQNPIDWNTIAVSYLGMFLMSGSFVAIGMFASSLSESQITAAIVSFAILLLLVVVGAAARGEVGFKKEFFEYLTVTGHLENFIRGVIKISDVVYYLSLGLLGILFTHRIVDAQRWR